VKGLDFNETYALFSKLTTLRYLLSFSAQNKWKLDHLDVVTAFLNPAIDAAVHMELPEGIEWLSAQTASDSPIEITPRIVALRLNSSCV